jgi:predicted SprT family Zn-dependent metalloprotease
MNPDATLRLANQIRHKIAPTCFYKIRLANSLEWAGRCDYSTGTIELSLEFMQAYDPYQVSQIVKHELAHALRGPVRPHRLNGHDEKWLKIAQRLGYEHGETVPHSWPVPKIIWNLTCTSTGQILETSTDPGDTCKLCNACTPVKERRQMVTQSTYSIKAEPFFYDPALERFKFFLNRVLTKVYPMP